MVRRVAAAALGSKAAPVVVVTGHEAERVRAALDGLDVAFAHNSDFAEGMSSSLHPAVSKRSTPSEPLGSTASWSASATCRAPRRR